MRAEPQEWDDTKAQKRDGSGGHRVSQCPYISRFSSELSFLRANRRAACSCISQHAVRLSVCWGLRAHISRIYCLGLGEAVPPAGPTGQATLGWSSFRILGCEATSCGRRLPERVVLYEGKPTKQKPSFVATGVTLVTTFSCRFAW